MSFRKYQRYHIENVALLIEEGNFYSCYLEDAYVMNYLFSFKLIYSNNLVKISFSKNSLEKVTSILKKRKCSYAVLCSDLITLYLPDNQYLKYLEQVTYLKDKMLDFLSKLSYSELVSITQDSFKL